MMPLITTVLLIFNLTFKFLKDKPLFNFWHLAWMYPAEIILEFALVLLLMKIMKWWVDRE